MRLMKKENLIFLSFREDPNYTVRATGRSPLHMK